MLKKIKFIVEMLKTLCNTLFMRIAYGMNRTKKEFAKLDISGEKFFLDNSLTGLQERLDMLMALREGDIVVLLSMADLGKGKSQIKAVEAIKATGAELEVLESAAPQGVMGRPKTVEFANDADLQKALEIWDMLPNKEALAMIEKQFKVSPDRNRMNYLKRSTKK